MIEIDKKRVVIVGMGRTAVALAALVQRHGGEPFVSDFADTAALAPYREALDALGVPYEVGGHSDATFERCDIVVPSPGVSPSIAPILRAAEAGATVACELDIAASYCTAPVLAVTGTNGKTTTTELLRVMIEACGHTAGLAGNNAVPFSAAVMADTQPDWMVLEVSSYALERIAWFRPHIGAVLNLSPDHLSRHGSMEAYAAAKVRLFSNCSAQDTAVLNRDDEAVYGMRAGLRARMRAFSLEQPVPDGLYLDGKDIREGGEIIASAGDVRLPGRHNIANALAALTMFRAGGFDWDRGLEALRNFPGVEHRIEFVCENSGVAIYNDSKSTNIDSLRVALESFEEKVVLIAGGRGKGADYRVLSPLVAERVAHLVVFGEDGPALADAFRADTQVTAAETLDDAVSQSLNAARAGQVVLFSPACASFDMFTNFEERGRAFKASVRRQALGEAACNAKPSSCST